MPQTNPHRIYAQQHATGARTWSEHRSQGGQAYVLEDGWTWCAEQLPPRDMKTGEKRQEGASTPATGEDTGRRDGENSYNGLDDWDLQF